MMELIIGFVIGLLVGWNLFPQPEWVSNLINKMLSALK